MKHFKLGASIYVPATRTDITQVANLEKFPARSIIFCTEDSVNASDVPQALDNLAHMLARTQKNDQTLKFIRVRNPEVLRSLLQMSDIDHIDGFVLPKVTCESWQQYADALALTEHAFDIMPTLETREVFDSAHMQRLRDMFVASSQPILSVRIGGNDLLHLLGIRRSAVNTIYESPLGAVISSLVTTFKPYGFNLTAPVCEFLHDLKLLNKEVPRDLEYGLFGKTAIHPDHIKVIETFYMVKETHLEMAQAILRDDAPAVFGMHGTMCEKATHSTWAHEIVERSRVYGIFGGKANR